MKISIIIPTVDEAGCIAAQVARCLALQPRPEVIVADGGSGDGTRRLAETAGARGIACPHRGRGSQMNAGAAAATGDLLIFLHADVTLPAKAYAALLQALADPDLIGGAFRRRFDSPSRLLALGCLLADLRGRWLRVHLGDQALFVRREAFRKLGGFCDIRLFEDLDFSRRMAGLGKTRLIGEPILASSRRFDQEGNLRRLSRNLRLTLLYMMGTDPDRLARRYYPHHFPGPPAPSESAAADPFPTGEPR